MVAKKSQLGVKMVVELLQVLREWNVHPDDLDEEEFVKRMFLDLRGKEIFDEVMGYVHTTDRKFYSVVWEICWLWRLVRSPPHEQVRQWSPCLSTTSSQRGQLNSES